MNDLTSSKIARENILNNDFAIYEIQNQLNITGIELIEEILWTKELVACYFDVDIRTIDRCIENNKEELTKNGYIVLRGEALKTLKEDLKNNFASDINVGTKVTALGVFSFRKSSENPLHFNGEMNRVLINYLCYFNHYI